MTTVLRSAAERCSDSAATRRQDVATGASPWNANRAIRSAAERRHDVATGVSPWNATRAIRSAAERRQGVAMGASPWNAVQHGALSPNGTTRGVEPRIHVAPLGLCHVSRCHHGLTPVATACRPFGTESQAATRYCDSAATRRQGVATGASPWNAIQHGALSPNGTTRGVARRIPVALSGLVHVSDGDHGLAPVATTCRPFGAESRRERSRLVAELHAQFAESAKLEQAIKANLRGLGYGV